MGQQHCVVNAPENVHLISAQTIFYTLKGHGALESITTWKSDLIVSPAFIRTYTNYLICLSLNFYL